MAFLPFQLPCASCAFLSQQFESGALGIQQQVAALLSIYLAADSVGMLAHKAQQEDENEKQSPHETNLWPSNRQLTGASGLFLQG